MSKVIPDIRSNYFEPNYDVDKIAPYTLEDPLTFLDGSKVKNADDWAKRRLEILDIFAKEMYGQEPPKPENLIIDVVDEREDVIDGCAIRTQYKMYFKEDKTGPCINWLLVRPRHIKGKCPVIIQLNYQGNHQFLMDDDIIISDMWIRGETHRVPEERGVLCNPNHAAYCPIPMLINAGYAFLTAGYGEISPDPEAAEPNPDFHQSTFAYTKCFELWGKRDESREDNITALGAWAWGLSRGIDLALQNDAIDPEQIILTGYSRLGKAALVAAARDERVSTCIPVQCGGGGVTLAKRDFGENIATEMKAFTHWYCKAYKKYERNPAELLTFDQHLFTACIAPRRLLIAGFDSLWFDTEGEYLACKAASCAWEICGKAPFPNVPYPADFETSAIGPDLGYYHRSQSHGINGFDWWQILLFSGLFNRINKN